MRIWAYCKGCDEWFACVRGLDGVVVDWRCPVCGLQPVSVQQSDGAPDEPGYAAPGSTDPGSRRRGGSDTRDVERGTRERDDRGWTRANGATTGTTVAASELLVRRGSLERARSRR